MSDKETNTYKLKIALITDKNIELQQKIDKAIEYIKQFINGETSRIDEWKNVELVLETIVAILGDKE